MKEDRKNTVSISSVIASIYIIFCAFVMSFNATDNLFLYGYSWTDSSVFRFVAKTMLHGGMPYRDTFDHKGPLLYIIDALGMRLNAHYGIYLTELVFLIVTFAIVYKTSRYVGCSRVASCAVVTLGVPVLAHYYEGGNLVEEYACAFIALSLYVFVKFFETGQAANYELILCGASFAAVCMLRVNMIALWVVMCLAVMIERIVKGKAADLIRFLVFFMLGVFLVIIPILIWLAVNGALGAFIEDYFMFNFMYSSDAERVSFANKVQSFYAFGSEYYFIISFVIMSFFCVYKKKTSDIAVTVSLVMSLIMISLSGQEYAHYGMILYPLMVFALSRITSYTELLSSGNNRGRRIACQITLFVLCAAVSLYSVFQVRKSITRSFSKKQDAYHSIAEIIDANTDKEDAITVCGNKDIIYLLSDRPSASVYSYQFPIADVDSDIKEAYISDVRQLNAKAVVITLDGFLYSELSPILDEHYELLDTVDKWEIYLLKQ